MSSEEGSQILPFYAVCDESGSMTGAPIDAINQALVELHAELSMEPVISDKARFSLIGFSDTAEVLLPLSDLTKVTDMPVMDAQNLTNYGAAFTLLRQTIEQDVELLKGDGNRVYRPAVFFMSDGQPTDNNWQQSLAALTDPSFPYHPNIIAFGVGGADANTISTVGSLHAFLMEQGTNPAVALREYAKALTKSIMMSGSQTGADVVIQVPDNIPGFTKVSADQL